MHQWLDSAPLFILVGLLCAFSVSSQGEEKLQFNRDIRPILSENCFQCHGADAAARKARLRLDSFEEATRRAVIVPGKPDESELIHRILATDPDDLMPPPDSNRYLSVEEKEVLRKWIAQGAEYQTHWAFQTPVRPALPEVRQTEWPQNGVDHFILAKLEAEGLEPAPRAPVPQLLRRVALDLTGLPPDPAQLQRWLAANDPVTAAVDELLASPGFGERMASDWLDVARYADTHGFNNDSMRSMWRWRDWVIDAFNQNLPYHRFLEEQLAGDLLPNPTLENLIASGFNRNHVINSEGGIIGEEYRVEYVADRVRTASLAWLGLTAECARCHDHKFDPISQKEYFELFAFFNNVDEYGETGRLANAPPLIAAPTIEQRLKMEELERQLRASDEKLEDLARQEKLASIRLEGIALPEAELNIQETNRLVVIDLAEGLPKTQTDDNKPGLKNSAGGTPFEITGNLQLTEGPAQKAMRFDGQTELRTPELPRSARQWAFSAWVRRDAAAEGPLFSTMNFDLPRSFERYGRGVEIRFDEAGAVEVRLTSCWPSYSVTVRTSETVGVGEWRHLVVYSDGTAKTTGVRIYLDGEEAFRKVIHEDFGDAHISGAARIGASGEEGSRKFAGALANYRLIARPKLEELLAEARANIARTASEVAQKPGAETFGETGAAKLPSMKALQRAALRERNPGFALALTRREELRAAMIELERGLPTTMIVQELSEPRETFVLFRGEYDKPRERVEPGVPAVLPPFPADQPRNRLGLARWLTDSQHPLTARVVVNRFWQSFFGTGIVKSVEDFGYQSDWPSHPELLDWLAVEFVESGWDVKQFVRLLVTSAAYQQDSRSSPELNQRDPENRLLARGPRQRLTAEMLRDQALSVSGLLRERIGGPPVFPYQPTNLYSGIVVAADYPGTKYVESTGDDLYRRSLYTFWKRTVPHPTLATFDAPDREFCVARRLRTNTPLQALASMNDPIQLEAARKLAERMLGEGGSSPADRIRFGFQIATLREPDDFEQRALESLLLKRLEFYRAEPGEAKGFLSIGASPLWAGDHVELAAYANIASLILNLDETLHRN